MRQGVHKAELTHGGTMMYSMEEQWLWYLTGAFDTHGSIKVNVVKDDRLNIGYDISPALYFSRPDSQGSVLGLIDEYAEEVNANINFHDSNNSTRVKVTRPNNIRNFLEPLLGGMIQQRERAEYFLDKVLPHFNDGPPQSKEEFIEVMNDVEQLQEYPTSSRSSKYDVAYFRKEWGMH